MSISTKSGSSAKSVSDAAHEASDLFRYLSWLDQYINPISSAPTSGESDDKD